MSGRSNAQSFQNIATNYTQCTVIINFGCSDVEKKRTDLNLREVSRRIDYRILEDDF